MGNYSGIKKVIEILGENETIIYGIKGGRQFPFPLEKDREYIIPGYQRELRWAPGNVQVLIDDLVDGSKFLGTITLSTSRAKEFEVIDGQQRLTVISLLINYLNDILPDETKKVCLCKITNKSFPKFNELVNYQFNYALVKRENLPLYEEVIRTDALSQKKDFKAIWDAIVERINSFSSVEQEKLYTAVLESDINVIVNDLDGTDTEKKFCVDYFIDINNKSVKLDALDIIRAYAFKEGFDEMTSKWIAIQNKCNALSGKIKYSRNTLFYQYFICMVNQEIDYKLTKLKEDFTTKEVVRVNSVRHDKGTYVWNLFSNNKFYSRMLNDLNDYLDFLQMIVSQETGGSDSFKELFFNENNELSDETRILNVHTIVNSIVRNDDTVPKMLILKYYLKVLKPKTAKGSQYKSIYDIKIIADTFTTSGKKKASEQIASRLLRKEWEKELSEYSQKLFREAIESTDFSKVHRINNKITVESGQYIARRYYILCDAYSNSSSTMSYDENCIKNMSITSGTFNVEHFLVNRGYEYVLYGQDDKNVDVLIKAPAKIKKYIATIANYILLDSATNSRLGNRPTYEKIELLEREIEQKGIDVIIPSKKSQLHYYLIKKYFHDESRYPAKAISISKTKEEKERALREYYNNYFEEEFHKLTNSLNSEGALFTVSAEKELISYGFERDKELCKLQYFEEIFFNPIFAEVDEVHKRIVLSVELYNPYYATEADEEEKYGELIDQVALKIQTRLHRDPEIHSSNELCDCPDESVEFCMSLPLRKKDIDSFIIVVRDISNELL